MQSHLITSHPTFQALSASVATGSVELVLVVDGVGAVAGYTSRGHILLLESADGSSRGVIFGTDLVGAVVVLVVERGDFGDVLAVGLAVVLNCLRVVLIFV